MEKRNFEIVYLRGIAILMVIFHHSNVYLWGSPGLDKVLLHLNLSLWPGVDLFFTISGYVIAESYFKKLRDTGSFSNAAKIFYIKRFIRIIPAAFFWLGIYLLLTKYFNTYGSFGTLKQNINDSYSAMFQYANYYGLKCWGPQKVMECGPNGIYWSLSLEEQFYFLLPILVYLLRDKLKNILIIIIMVSALISRPEWTFGWAFRLDAIAWGIFLSMTKDAKIYSEIRRILEQNNFLQLIAFILLLSGLIFTTMLKAAVPIVAFVSFIFVMIAVGQQRIFFPSSLINNLLYWLGSRSYSIYLTHIISFRLFQEIYQSSILLHSILPESAVLLIGPYSILLICSESSYRFVEIPSRNLAAKIAWRFNRKEDL